MMPEPIAQTAGAVLITAGAYVGAELAAEFGRLPPAFLPVGNRRLLAHQLNAVSGHFGRILMSLPEGFAPEPHDRAALEAAGVELVFVPVGLDLPASILHAIAESGLEGGPFAVLHGDTLIFDIDYSVTDAISVAEMGAAYEWAGCQVRDGKVVEVADVPQGGERVGPVLSGFFHFDDLNLLVLALAASRGKFADAIDRYVRRRPMRALSSERWLDFGHVHTYYASRGQITTQRAFNGLAIAHRSIVKSSAKPDRIEAEAHWYETVPPALRLFLPQYLGRSNGAESYALEFLHLASLADLFTFGALPRNVWAEILGSCGEFLSAAAAEPAPEGQAGDVMAMYLPKTLARLEDYARATGMDLDRGWTINGEPAPGLAKIAVQTAAAIPPPERRHLTVVHGDCCFSNILYDFRSRSVRMIDPRGQDAAGSPTIWGDNRYDRAKLHHSAVGLYDFIIAGYVEARTPAPYVTEIGFPSGPAIQAAQDAYFETIAASQRSDLAAIEAINVHLFLSMLPLHADSPSRQQAMLANALRLWQEIDRGRRAA
jgi:hypothetical protein